MYRPESCAARATFTGTGIATAAADWPEMRIDRPSHNIEAVVRVKSCSLCRQQAEQLTTTVDDSKCTGYEPNARAAWPVQLPKQ